MLKSRAFLIPGIVVIALSIIIGNACADNARKSWKIGLRFAPGYDLPRGSFGRFFDDGPSFDGSLIVRATKQMDLRLTVGKVGLKNGETPVPVDLSAYRIVGEALYHTANPKTSPGSICPYAIGGLGVIKFDSDIDGHSDSGTDFLLTTGGGICVHILSNIVLDISAEFDVTVSGEYKYLIINNDIEYYNFHYCNILKANAGLILLI